MSENTEFKKLIRQNEVIISLLGRMVFSPDQIRDIVTHGKRKNNKDNYVKGYNSCNGNHGVVELSNIIGVAHNTLSPILADWEEIGIIYEIDKPNGKFYKKIMPI